MSAAAEAERLLRALHGTRTVVEHGRVVQAGGTILRATGLRARIGQQCRVFDSAQPGDDGGASLIAEVIGFAGHEVILAPYGPLQGIAVGAAVQALPGVAQVPYGEGLLGRVIDPFGRPRDRSRCAVCGGAADAAPDVTISVHSLPRRVLTWGV